MNIYWWILSNEKVILLWGMEIFLFLIYKSNGVFLIFYSIYVNSLFTQNYSEIFENCYYTKNLWVKLEIWGKACGKYKQKHIFERMSNTLTVTFQ